MARLLGTLCLLTLGFSGCSLGSESAAPPAPQTAPPATAPPPAAESPPAAPPAGGMVTWRLVALDGPGGTVSLEGREITLALGQRRFYGMSTCNSYGGRVVRVDDEQIRLGGVGRTAVACSGAIRTIEGAYLSALQASEQIERSETTLVLAGPSTELRFERLRSP